MTEFIAVFVSMDSKEEDGSVDIKEEDGSVDIKEEYGSVDYKEEYLEEEDPLSTTSQSTQGKRKINLLVTTYYIKDNERKSGT